MMDNLFLVEVLLRYALILALLVSPIMVITALYRDDWWRWFLAFGSLAAVSRSVTHMVYGENGMGLVGHWLWLAVVMFIGMGARWAVNRRRWHTS